MSEVMAHDRQAGGGDPHAMRPGAGMPAGRDATPPYGTKPDGALFKKPGQIAPGRNVTDPRKPGAPGATEPSSPRNRDMSFLLPPAVPGTPRAARG